MPSKGRGNITRGVRILAGITNESRIDKSRYVNEWNVYNIFSFPWIQRASDEDVGEQKRKERLDTARGVSFVKRPYSR